MNYHNILHDNMLNGDGLRVVLFLSGCSHRCKGCQNPQTWDENSGIEFDNEARKEIFEQLSKDYIDGITFSGGDPFYRSNIDEVSHLIHDIKVAFPGKTIWVYTGFTYEEISSKYPYALCNVDVLVDGKYEEKCTSINYAWAGSTNQRVINVQETLKKGEVTLWQEENVR